MATIRIPIPMSALRPVGSNFPERKFEGGTNFGVDRWAFDAATEEALTLALDQIVTYGSGDLTVDLDWFATSATSGVCRWGVSLAAYTPETDSTSILSKAFATEVAVNDTHLGTTAQRVMRATLTLDQLDSIASGDLGWLKIARKAADVANDTMTGDAELIGLFLSYSDT